MRVARVFAGDLVGFLEDAKGAQGDVLKIADRRANEIEAASGVLGRGRHERSVARQKRAAWRMVYCEIRM